MARTGVLALMALLMAGACRAAPAPDYVLTQTWRNGPTATRAQTILHHAGWFRIDQPDGSYYEAPRQGFQLGVTHYGQVETNAVSFWRRSPSIVTPAGRRKVIGAKSDIAGELCSLWRIYERQGKSDVPTREGCTTADGIDLWNAAPSAEPPLAVRVERRPVLAAEVTPPLGLLDLDAWPRPILQADLLERRGDYEIILTRTSKSHDAGEPRRWTYFKSGAWGGSRISSEGKTFGDGMGLSPAGVVSIVYQVRAGRLQTMRISVQPTKQRSRAAAPPASPQFPTGERVLGEACTWETPTPAPEEDTQECRAADGAILKIWTSSWGHVQTWRATRIRRAPVPLSRLLPPTDPSIAAAWKVR